MPCALLREMKSAACVAGRSLGTGLRRNDKRQRRSAVSDDELTANRVAAGRFWPRSRKDRGTSRTLAIRPAIFTVGHNALAFSPRASHASGYGVAACWTIARRMLTVLS
jgi:hypothetical protein